MQAPEALRPRSWNRFRDQEDRRPKFAEPTQKNLERPRASWQPVSLSFRARSRDLAGVDATAEASRFKRSARPRTVDFHASLLRPRTPVCVLEHACERLVRRWNAPVPRSSRMDGFVFVIWRLALKATRLANPRTSGHVWTLLVLRCEDVHRQDTLAGPLCPVLICSNRIPVGLAPSSCRIEIAWKPLWPIRLALLSLLRNYG